MTTDEFNQQLTQMKQGKDTPELLALLRKMVCGFLRKVSYLDDAVIDDLLGSIVVRLLRLDAIPARYSWNSWFWYAMRSTWREWYVCEDQQALPLSAAYDQPARSLPIPVEVNARLVGEELVPIILRRVMQQAPQALAVRQIWECAAKLLLIYGAVQNDRLAALRFKTNQETARRAVAEAVLTVRESFESLYRSGEFETLEECEVARELAERLY